MKNLRSVFAAFTIVQCLWVLPDLALADQEQSLPESRGFNEAQKLEGRWVRMEGGYVLVLRDIKPDGSIEAFYLNPRSINVHEATWKFEDEQIYLYVELLDVNYPGSNYSLIYRAGNDTLWGSYYQAVQKLTMNVRFVRTK